MHLLIAGFASIGYLYGEAGLRELTLEFEFVLWYFLIILFYFFDVSAVGSVKQNLSGKECDKALQAVSLEAVIMLCLFPIVLWVGL